MRICYAYQHLSLASTRTDPDRLHDCLLLRKTARGEGFFITYLAVRLCARGWERNEYRSCHLCQLRAQEEDRLSQSQRI